MKVQRTIAMLAVALAIAFGCEDDSVTPPPPPPEPPLWEIKPDSANVGILVLDYLTYEFEGGRVDHFAPCDSCDRDSLPFEQIYVPPLDVGTTTFRYVETADTVLVTSVIWNGRGSVRFPTEFIPASEFMLSADHAVQPNSKEYFWNDQKTASFAAADTAWSRVQGLDVVEAFAKREYRVGIYWHAARVANPEPAYDNWVVFLYASPSLGSRETTSRIGPGP